MKLPSRTEFLDRSSYRQRRFRDAARWLPIFAGVLMLLPLMWPHETPDQSQTSNGIVYLFGLWVILVVLAFVLSRVLRLSESLDGNDAPNGWGGE